MSEDVLKKVEDGCDAHSSWLVCKRYCLARQTPKIRSDLNARLQLFTEAAELALAEATQQSRSCSVPVWQDMLLCGAQDVWSRVRQVSVDGLGHLVRALCQSEQTTSTKHGDAAYSPAAALLLDHILAAWRRATVWYAKDGLLRLLARVPLDGAARRILFTCVLPALSEPQLPVREAAADLLVGLVAVDARLASVAVDRVVTVLESALPCAGDATQGRAPQHEAVHHVEGCLLGLVQLCRRHCVRAEAPDVRRLLFRLAAHAASSVRQYVAEALAPPSPALFGELVRRISRALDERVVWQEQETLLMALQQHLTHYCRHGTPAPLLPQRTDTATHATRVCERNGHACNAEAMHAASLTALLDMATSVQFEVQRMAQQVLPLYLQFYTRDSPSPCEAVLSTTEALLVRLRDDGDDDKSAELISDLVLPSLWWYLAIRVAVQPGIVGDTQRAAVHKLHDSLFRIWRWRFVALLLILETYFVTPQRVPGEDDEGVVSMLHTEAWRVLIGERQRHFDSLRFGTDFVPVVWLRMHRGASTLRLVPTWTSTLCSLLTHQQCLLIAMLRQTMLAEFGQLGQASFFRFAYRSAFTAPTVVDGGEELAWGYVWLRQNFATEAQLPSIAPVTATVDDGGTLTCHTQPPHYAAACTAISHDVFGTVYGDVATEPVVLQEIRQLMVALCDADAGYWRRVVVAAVVARLDAVAPTWCTFVCETDRNVWCGTAAQELSQINNPDDDWDSGEDMDGHVAGSSLREEVGRASALLAELKRRNDGDGDFAAVLVHDEKASSETSLVTKLRCLLASSCAE